MTMDKTRLGVGFGINSDRSQGNQTFITQPVLVPPEDEDEEKRAKPVAVPQMQ
jgi:hypothetical protein